MAAEAVPGKSHTYQQEINTDSSVRKSRNPTIREILSQIESHEYRSIEHLVSLLIVVWTCLADKVDYFHDVQSIFKFAHSETAKVVLSGSWPKIDQSYKRGLARALIQCSQILGNRVENSANLCSSLVMTIYDPWGDPAISQLIKNEDVNEKIVEDFIVSEPTELMLIRIEYLVNASLEDCAIRLCRFCLKSEGLSKINSQEDDHRENWKVPFMEWLLQLRFRQQQLNNLIADCADLSCHDGLALILRIQKSRKIDSEALAETLIHLFLIRNLLFQKTYCCTRELMRLWCDCQIRKQCSLEEVQTGARKIIVGHASNSAHFYVFVDMLWEKYGIALLPLYLEFFVRGLTSDLNFLESARQADAKESIMEIENHMATVYFKLSSLFVDINNEISLECMLSSFSLNPTREKLDIIKKLSVQIAMAKANRTSSCHPMNSLNKDGRLRPILTNCIVTKRNPVIMCDRGIQVGESAQANPGGWNSSSDGNTKNKKPTVSEKCHSVSQNHIENSLNCNSACNDVDDDEKTILQILNNCVEQVESRLDNSNVSAVLVNEVTENDNSPCNKSHTLPSTDLQEEKLKNYVSNEAFSRSQNCFALPSIPNNLVKRKSLCNDSIELSKAVNRTLIEVIDTVVEGTLHNKEQKHNTHTVKSCDNNKKIPRNEIISVNEKTHCSDVNNLTDKRNIQECLIAKVNSVLPISTKKTRSEIPCCKNNILEKCKNRPCHNENINTQHVPNGDITDIVENGDVGKSCSYTKEVDCKPVQQQLCEISSDLTNKSGDNKDEVSGKSFTKTRPENNIMKVDDTLCRQYLTFRQTRNHEIKGFSFDKGNTSYPLNHRVMNAKVPGVSNALLADFIIVLESLRNPLLKFTSRWNETKNICENYMESVLTMRKVFMNTQLNGSIYSEDDSTSEVSPLGKLEFASFQSDDSVYNDPKIDKSPIFRRFLNHNEDVRFSTYVNLSDIHHPYLDLDRLFCVGATANPHEHAKHRRRHRDKVRDAKKGVLKQLLHSSGYNHELTKRKKKKRKRGRKEKSHNKKHHSNHNKTRNNEDTKKKRNRKKNKAMAIDLAGGDYCSDFSSTELMRLVKEHSNDFPQINSSQAIRQTVASGSDSGSCSNSPLKKKRKQVSFKKIKDKKNILVKSHDKHRHSKSKRSKKKSDGVKNVNSVQDYSHIVEISSVKQMQSVRIRQSSMSMDLSNVPKRSKTDAVSLQQPECDVNKIPAAMNSALNPCSDDDMRKIQMLLVNKQSSPAVCARDPFQDNLLYNKQTVLKYVSSKTTSHLLSVAQASNRILVQNPDTTSAIRSLNSTQALLPTSGKYVIAGRGILPAPGPSTSQAIAIPRGPVNIPSANSPIITTLTLPMNQSIVNAPGAKIISGKIVIPLGSSVSSTNANAKSLVSNVVVSSGSTLYPASNVIIVKKDKDSLQIPVNAQQLQNILPLTSTFSKYPIAANRRGPITNKILPSTARKVVKKYTQPYFPKKPIILTKPISQNVISEKFPPIMSDTTLKTVKKILPPLEIASLKTVTDSAEEKRNISESAEQASVKETCLSKTVAGDLAAKELPKSETNDCIENEILPSNISEKESSEVIEHHQNISVIKEVGNKSSLLDSDSAPIVQPIDKKPDEDNALHKTENNEVKATSKVEDEVDVSSSADASLLKASDDESNYESTNEEEDESGSPPSSPKSSSIPTPGESDIGNEEPSESLPERNISVVTVTSPQKFTTLDLTQIAHKTQLQPLASSSGNKSQMAASKSDSVNQSEVPTRSLTSISDAVRFSLMDMDDATGSVENQVLQAFHSFPAEAITAVAFVTHETSNANESTITTLTTSANISTQSSQTYQAAVRTSQCGTFAECQMTASSSASREWNATDPAALVSSILAAKTLETDSAGELKDEDRIKKKRKKKEKTEKDPDAIQRFWCEICNRGFFSAYNLRRHCRNVHKMDLPKGSSDVPFTSSSTQCLTLVGDRVICSAVSEAGTQSVATPISGGSKTPEFIMQSPTSDPKTKEFSHQTSPQSHTKQIQQQVSQALNQSPNFNLHSPPISPITPPKDFRMQTVAPSSISQGQQTNFMNVATNLPKPVPKFQMIQAGHAPGPTHPVTRLGTVHQPVVSAPSQMIQQPRLVQPGTLIPKPPEIQTANIVQPLPCQVQQIQQNVQCPLAQGKKQDQRSVMLQAAQHEAQEQALRIARHTAEVQAQHKAIQQQQQQAFKKNVQLVKADVLPQVPIQISQASAISHIQPPILNPQMQKLVQIRQAALCRSPEFTLQLPVQSAVAESHTSPVKSPIQYFQAQVSGPQHQSVLHSAVRQTLASCAAVRQANPGYIGQPIQNIASAEFLSRLVPHASQERPSCAQPFSMPSTDLCLVSNQPHAPVIRQSTETSEGLEDLEQFLLENMAWSGGGEMTSQVQQSLNRPGVDGISLPITVKQAVGVMQPAKSNPLGRNKSTVTKPKACKPTLAAASKNFIGSKSCQAKKKTFANKKSQELSCSESLKTGFSSVSAVTIPEKKNCGNKAIETHCEKAIGCCMVSTPSKEAATSCSVDENDSISSDSVQCIEITRNNSNLKGVNAGAVTNFNVLPHAETKSPGFYKVPTFCNPNVRTSEHLQTPPANFGITVGTPILNVGVVTSQPLVPLPAATMPASKNALPNAPGSLNTRHAYPFNQNNATSANFTNPKCHDGLTGCAPKPVLPPPKVPLIPEKQNETPSCISKDSVDPVIPLYETNSLQNDNLDAEKELKNLQSKIQDCEKHLKNSEKSREIDTSANKTTGNVPETSCCLKMQENTNENILTNDKRGDLSKNMSFLSSDKIPTTGIGTSASETEKSSGAVVQSSSISATMGTSETAGKGIHFLDEQTAPVYPALNNSLFQSKETMSNPTSLSSDICPKNLNSVSLTEKASLSKYATNADSVSGATSFKTVSDNQQLGLTSIMPRDNVGNLVDSHCNPMPHRPNAGETGNHINQPAVNVKVCNNNGVYTGIEIPGNTMVPLHNVQGFTTENGRSDYTKDLNLNTAKDMIPNVISTADQNHGSNAASNPATVSNESTLHTVLKQGDSELNAVNSSRTRLRDMPKTSVKRSCPCCTDTCPPKKCRTNSNNNMSIFLAKLPKTNQHVKPNGPQKPKNIIAFKGKNSLNPVKTRSSHRLRSRNGSVT